MSVSDQLKNTGELLHQLGHFLENNSGYDNIKQQLQVVLEDLSTYKVSFEKEKNKQFQESTHDIEDILEKISYLESLVQNKLIISEKYNNSLKS